MKNQSNKNLNKNNNEISFTKLDFIREYLKLSNELIFNKFKEESDKKNHLKKEKRSKK